ncbi:MAG: DUF1854 domain-containing protein [Gemmatimonadetes bacterium]|nr:DUF1854 domain-containing protein [Gemmatimonadota bacterium]NNF37778.1 DUF1854 domain-containing protein [Gemmatimonadota bacterium]
MVKLKRVEGDALRLERRADGQLWAVRGEQADAVRVRRLFPWSGEHCHVSLRDADNREVALIGPDQVLDGPSRRTLDEAIVSAGFVLEVTRVLAVEEEIEIRVWRVDTRQGPRTFQTPLDDWPREMDDGGLLIRDVAGDLYRVPEPESLDARSRSLLWAFAG